MVLPTRPAHSASTPDFTLRYPGHSASPPAYTRPGGQWHHERMGIHFMHVLSVLFGWPAGIVLGNLIANMSWLPVQWAALHVKLRAHQGAVHDRLDDILSRLEACPNCGHRRSEADLQPSHEPS